MREIQNADEFLKSYGADYRKLLEAVQAACERLQQAMGYEIIGAIYTREKSAGKGNIFKEANKIANKIRQKGMAPEPKSYLELNDNVGLTVVAKYPDAIPHIVKALRKELHKQRINVGSAEEHINKGGYYATHVDCTGVYSAEKLKCEVQIKSMLHDAWSAKMHDLTYKPVGSLDPKLNALMASIASTIESLEQQSILVRDMIKSNWNVEEATRRVARHELFASMLKYDTIDWLKAQPHLQGLRAEIERESKVLAMEPKDGKTVSRLTNAVNNCCSKAEELRYGWVMAGRIASLRTSPDLVRFFTTQVTAWLLIAPGLLEKGDIKEREIVSVPLFYYVIGDIDRAIESAEALTSNPRFASLSQKHRANLDFNRATFLIEREYHHPTKNGALRDRLRTEIEAILAAPDIALIPEIESPLLDTRGLLTITFANTQDEARRGIEDCILARKEATPDDKTVADTYADLNMRLGWRRYFELEGK